MRISVSVLVPALNEARNIRDCLSSVAWSDDIVVVDSGSTDETVEIVNTFGARLVQFTYVPGSVKKKNWALSNVEFKNDWILIVDADERITPPLAQEIANVVSDPQCTHSGFYVNRRFYFLGRWIRHAGYFPSWNLRLLKKGRGLYEQVPDAKAENGDNEVHEHILLEGTAGYLRAPMEHFAFPSISSFVDKHNRYSSWEAQTAAHYLPRPSSGIAFHLRARRVAKRLGRQLPLTHVSRFIYHYFLKAGFLDGKEGYTLCRLLSEYEFLIWAKTVEMRRTSLISQPGLSKS